MKRLIGIILTVSMLAGIMAISAVGASSAQADLARTSSQNTELKVKLTGTKQDLVRGYYFEYTLNGIPYRSDEVGASFNKRAVENMTDVEKEKVLMVFYFMKSERESQLGTAYAKELNDWYLGYKGWKQGAKVLSDRLAAKNFPEYQERFGADGGAAYFNEFFKPDAGDTIQNSIDPEMIELQKLYDEQKLVFSWAGKAYQGMVAANNIRTRVAVQSLSGDLIQLICDKVLVPNITPAGAGGVAAQINSLILDYKMSISGLNDDIQDLVLGKRVRADVASEIISKMAETIDYNELIIRQCCQEAHRLQKEINEKCPDVIALINDRRAQTETTEKQQQQEIIDATFVDVEAAPDAANAIYPIVEKLNNLNAADFDTLEDYYAEKSRLETALEKARKQIRDQYLPKLKSWVSKYFGTENDNEITASSVIGKFVAGDPNDLMNDWMACKYDLYSYDPLTTDVNALENDYADFSTVSKQYLQILTERNAQGRDICIQARNEYEDIISRLGVSGIGDETLSNNLPYYLRAVNAVGGLYIPQNTDISSVVNQIGASFPRSYQLENITLQEEYYALDYAYEKNKVGNLKSGITSQVSEYNSCVSEYRQANADYQTSIQSRSELLESMPEYIKNTVVYKDNAGITGMWTHPSTLLGQMFIEDNAEGTKSDIARIGKETEEYYRKYQGYTAQIEISSNEIYGLGRNIQKLYGNLYGGVKNESLIPDISDPDEIKESIPAVEVSPYDNSLLQRLEYVRNDFNHRQYYHSTLMNCYFTLLDNYDTYAVPTSLTEEEKLTDEYMNLRRKALQFAPDDARRRFYSFSCYLDPKVPTGETDPYKLVLPLINEIDAARADGVFKGDMSGDFMIDAVDVTLIQRIAAGIDVPGEKENALRLGDIDGNGKLDLLDASYIQRYIVHLPIPYKIDAVVV